MSARVEPGDSASITASLRAAVDPLDFDTVYRRNVGYVYRLMSRLAVGHDVEDLVQEVFVVVHRRLPEFEGRARMTTWLFRIAYRVAAAHARRQRLRARLYRIVGRDDPVIEPPRGPRAIEVRERERAVRRALSRLPFEKRAVLLLHEVEGWQCARIAEHLGIPVGTVHSRLHHARAAMARQLGALEREGW